MADSSIHGKARYGSIFQIDAIPQPEVEDEFWEELKCVKPGRLVCRDNGGV